MKKSSIFKPIKRTSLRQELVENILSKIFSGELAGGDRLVERDLADQLGVSRTPIREALTELAAIGMVQINPNHRVEVKPFTKLQLSNIYQVRQILETSATEMSCVNIPHEALQELHKEIVTLLAVSQRSDEWTQKALILDQSFHMLIGEYCGNQRLADEIERYRNLVQALRLAAKNKTFSQAEALESHLAIINAMLIGDAKQASANMKTHIQQAANDALETVFDN